MANCKRMLSNRNNEIKYPIRKRMKRDKKIVTLFGNREDQIKYDKIYNGCKQFFECDQGVKYNVAEDIVKIISIFATGKIKQCDHCEEELLILSCEISHKYTVCRAFRCDNVICIQCKAEWDGYCNDCDEIRTVI
eukprot:441550_1